MSLAAVKGPKPGSVSRCGATSATSSAIRSSAMDGDELAQAAQLIAGDANAHRLLRAREPPGDARRAAAVEQRAAGHRDWILRGELPAYKLGKEWRIRRDDFDNAMQARRTTAEPAPLRAVSGTQTIPDNL